VAERERRKQEQLFSYFQDVRCQMLLNSDTDYRRPRVHLILLPVPGKDLNYEYAGESFNFIVYAYIYTVSGKKWDQ